MDTYSYQYLVGGLVFLGDYSFLAPGFYRPSGWVFAI